MSPPALSIGLPTANFVALDGAIHLATDYLGGVQYFNGSGFTPITWSPLVYALGTYNIYLLGYELHSVASDPALGYVYVCSTEDTEQPTEPVYSSTVLFTRSLDNGLTWQRPLRISSPYSKGSSMAVAADGTIYVAWADYSTGQALVSRSTDHGATFGAPLVAADMLDNLYAKPVGLRAPQPDRTYPWYIDFNLAPNFPALAVDRGNGPARGSLYLTWADYAGGVEARATQTLAETEPNDTPETAQHLPLDCDLFGTLASIHTGTDHIDFFEFDATAGQTLWLDGRAFGETTGCLLLMEMPDGSLQQAGFLRLMYFPDVPATGRPKSLVYTAPRTGRYFLELATTFYGTGYQLKLRNYAPTSTSAARDMRDIVLVHSTDGGVNWSPKLRVNHDVPGHDQCMPNVAVDGQGRVYVGWYDRRDAANGDSVNAYASVSTNGGQSFGPDLKLSSRSSGWIGPELAFVPLVPGDLIGDRIAVAAGDDYGIVAWADFRDWPTRSDIYAARVMDIPTAVEAVSDLGAEPVAGGVRVTWTINDARAVSGLRVYRALQGAEEIALGDADIVPRSAGRLDYLDVTIESGHTYSYRLQVRGTAGTRWLGPVTVTTPPRITALAWRAALPNPFARRTSVKLAVPRAAVGTVRVYDVQGKEVRTLAEGAFQPGERDIEWDGRDASGGVAAPGIYFVAATVGGQSARLRVARVP